MEKDNIQLTDQEMLFCDLYVHGEVPLGGNATKCYQEVYNDISTRAKARAIRMLARPEIQAYLKSLDELPYEEAKYMKIFLREHLTSIITECSTYELRDRKGHLQSPAALRSIAVQASKVLVDMYGCKEANVNKINIEGGGEGGITFNVIMPESTKEE